MNREIFKPTSVGVILIWFIMYFRISFSYYFLLFLLSLSITLYCLYLNKQSLYLLIILFSCFLGLLGVSRTLLIEDKSYIPLKIENSLIGDILVLKDSVPINGGFFASGIIYNVENSSIKISANENINIISDKGLFRGQILIKSSLVLKDGSWFSTVKNPWIIFKNDLYKLRKNVIQYIKNSSNSSLFVGLLTGNKIYLSKEIIDLFRRGGCSHILALSGFHVSIISLIILIFIRLFLTGNKVYYFAGFILILFLIFVGVSASLLRSVIMFIVGISFKTIKYKVTLFFILIITFYIIIIIFPSEFYTLSFQLSFLALYGILVLNNEFKSIGLIKILPNFIKSSISASLSAMLTTAYVVYPLFGVIYPIGIIISIILTPIITIFIIIGLISLVFPNLNFILFNIENLIYKILEFSTKSKVIDNSGSNSTIVTLTMIIIPVILVILKIYRRRDARGFNIKFKL